MSKFVKWCLHSTSLYDRGEYFTYPYRNNNETVTDSEKLYPPIPYYVNGYLIKDVNGETVLSQRQGSSYGCTMGIGSYNPENHDAYILGITSNSYNNSHYNSQSDVALRSPVTMQKHDGELSLPGSNSGLYYYLFAFDVDGIDAKRLTLEPATGKCAVSIQASDKEFFSDYGYSSLCVYTTGYYVECSGSYGDFDFIGIIFEPADNALYFINKYPDLSHTCNDTVGDLPDEDLDYYGATLDNILYGLDENDYLRVDLDEDDLQRITFTSQTEDLPENVYMFFLHSYNIVYTGSYSFKKTSGETIATLTEKPPIKHYELTVNGNQKTLALTYSNGLQDSIIWESENSGKVFSGLGLNSGILEFMPGDYDCDIYGSYEFVEFWETPVMPTRTFTVKLYKLTGDAKLLDKTDYIESMLELEGVLKNDCSLVSPIIRATVDYETEHEKLLQCNYAYIEQFNRYYFINDIVAYRTNIYTLYMHTDVLMTYKDAVLNTGMVKVERTSIYRNKLLEDNKDIIEPSNTVSVLDFTDLSDDIQPELDGLSDIDVYTHTIDYCPLNEWYEFGGDFGDHRDYVFILSVLGDNDRFYDGITGAVTLKESPETMKIEPKKDGD